MLLNIALMCLWWGVAFVATLAFAVFVIQVTKGNF